MAGIDRQTIADVEQYGVSRLLDELAADLREGRWRPLPARRVFIEKPGREELRPLSIPTVRDRVVQAAAKIVIEPIIECPGATGGGWSTSTCTGSTGNGRRAGQECWFATRTIWS